jgi:hypothetical protein
MHIGDVCYQNCWRQRHKTVTTVLVLATLGDASQNRIVYIFCQPAQSGQGKYKCVAHRPIYRSVVSLLRVIVAGFIVPNFANVNTA